MTAGAARAYSREESSSRDHRPFRVWAPHAHAVALVLGDRRISMRSGSGGWHEVEAAAPAGAEYAFSVDGGPPRPDPRSAWQPRGIEGPSVVVDHTGYPWRDEGWRAPPLKAAIVYELHVGTFTPQGTFRAVVEKLDHLVDLGVTAVELMPVAEFSGSRGWGYDSVDLYATHHAYGTPDDLKYLVDCCHRRGLAAIVDVVYNHVGPAGNHLHEFGPYFTDRYATPWGEAVNFDGPGSHEVRQFLVENALMWLRDYHFDGIRVDAVHAIVDTSAIHFLEQLNERVEALQAEIGRSLCVIAESDLNDPRIVRSPGAGGFGLDAMWSDDFHHSLHALLTGERNGYYRDFGSVAHLAASLTRGFVYDGRYSAYRDRIHGRPTTGLSGHYFFGYLQNHDQVGNRAAGERSSRLMSTGLLEVAAALVLTSPFVPMLFQGEEWGATTPFLYFTDHADPALGAAVRAGRRRDLAAFDWSPEDVPDPQDAATFEVSKLDWDEPHAPPRAELLDWRKRLIALRKATPALTDGRMDLVRARYDEDGRWLVVERGPVTVACNFSTGATAVPVAEDRRALLLLASGPAAAANPGAVELRPESVAIWSRA